MEPRLNVRQWIRRFDLLTLRLFLSVAEERSLVRAAVRESLAPSAATKRIQALEDGLGVQLFFRNSRGTELTPAGLLVMQHVQAMLASLESLSQVMGKLVGDLEGRLRIWATPSSIVEFLARDVAAFTRSYPLVRLELQSSNTTEVLRATQGGQAEVGICAAPPRAPADLIETEYRRDRLVAVMPRLHPLASEPSITFRQVLDSDMVGWSPEGSLMTWMQEQAVLLGRKFIPRFHVPSIDAARALVRAGLGLAVMPEGMVMPFEDLDLVCAVPLAEASAERRLCAYTRDAATAATLGFVSFLAASQDEPPVGKHA